MASVYCISSFWLSFVSELHKGCHASHLQNFQTTMKSFEVILIRYRSFIKNKEHSFSDVHFFLVIWGVLVCSSQFSDNSVMYLAVYQLLCPCKLTPP